MVWVALAQEIWMDWDWVMAFATWCLDKGGKGGSVPLGCGRRYNRSI